MKKILGILLAAAMAAAALLGCTRGEAANGGESPEGTLRIVTTIFPPYDFARAAAGGNAELTMLLKPGAETHSFEPSPADIIAIRNADIFIYTGGENDKWVDTILESIEIADKTVLRMVDMVETVEEESVEGMQDDHHHDDEEDGHEHSHEDEDHDHEDHEEAELDEHVWTSPKNAVTILSAISGAMCEADADHAEVYRENTAAYVKQLEALDVKIRGIVDEADHKLLLFGDRFPLRYFADAYGLEYRAAFPGCSTDTEASAGTMAYLIDTVKDQGLPYIYYIELSGRKIADAICEQTGAEALLFHSCHNVTKEEFEAGETYVSLMERNAENLQKGLGV